MRKKMKDGGSKKTTRLLESMKGKCGFSGM
jgi:hypothetical protein